MKRNILFFVFAFTVLLSDKSFSQSVKWSAPMTDDKKFPYLKILGASDEGYYLLRSNLTFSNDRTHSGFRTRKYLLQLLDDDLRLRWSQPLVATCEDCRIADVGIIGSNVAVLYSKFDKQKKLLQLNIEKLDASGKNSGTPVQLLEIQAEKVDEDNQPDLLFSHSENMIGCAMRSIAKDKHEQLYTVVVFDTNLAVLSKKEIQLQVDAKLFGPITSVITDEGNFYLLGIEYKTEKRVKNAGESFYNLVSYNLKNDVVTTNEIKLENKFLTDVAISADNLNHNIVVSGFYSERTTYSTAGIFYYSLNEDSLMQTPVVTSAFSPDFLKKLAEGRDKNNELNNYSIDRSVLRKDGGAAIVAESYYISSQSYWDYYMQTWVYHYYYHYGNIIAFSINPDGNILWGNVISKDQNSTDDGGYFSSYFSAIVNGKIMSIYNKYISDQSSVLLTSVTGAGQQDTQKLFEESENVSVIPRSAKQVDEATILMAAERDGEPYLVKIYF